MKILQFYLVRYCGDLLHQRFSILSATLQVQLTRIAGSVPPTWRIDYISIMNIFHGAELADSPFLAFPVCLIIDPKIVYYLRPR